MSNEIREGEHLREIYYRFYLRMSPGWRGVPDKMARATVFTDDNWSQAMVAHLWGASKGNGLRLDPVSCISDEYIRCTKYNHLPMFTWLGARDGWTSIHAPHYNDRWTCIETSVKLNSPGKSDGEQKLWIDGELDTSLNGLSFVANYKKRGLNAVFLENYWNNGKAPASQKRELD